MFGILCDDVFVCCTRCFNEFLFLLLFLLNFGFYSVKKYSMNIFISQ